MDRPKDSKLNVIPELGQNKMVIFTDASNLNNMCVEQVSLSTILDRPQSIKQEKSFPCNKAHARNKQPQNELLNMKKEHAKQSNGGTKITDGNNVTESLTNAPSKNNQIFCFCGKEFKTYTDCKIHHTEAHETPKKKGKFECVLCNQIFDNDLVLKKHMMDIHYILSDVKKDASIDEHSHSYVSKDLAFKIQTGKLNSLHNMKVPMNDVLKPDPNNKMDNESMCDKKSSSKTVTNSIENKEVMQSIACFTDKSTVINKLNNPSVKNENFYPPGTTQTKNINVHSTTSEKGKSCSAVMDISETFGNGAKTMRQIPYGSNCKTMKLNPVHSKTNNYEKEVILEQEEIFCSTDSQTDYGSGKQGCLNQLNTNLTSISSKFNKTLNSNAKSSKYASPLSDYQNTVFTKNFPESLETDIEIEEINPQITEISSTKNISNGGININPKRSLNKSLMNTNSNVKLSKLPSPSVQYQNTVRTKNSHESINPDIIEIEEITPEITEVFSTKSIISGVSNSYPTGNLHEHLMNINSNARVQVTDHAESYSTHMAANKLSCTPISENFKIRKTAQGGGICQLCGSQYEHYSSCKVHYIAKHGETTKKEYFCLVCKEGFTFEQNLTSHMKKIHYISRKLTLTNEYGGMIAKTDNGGGVCLKCCKQYQHYSSCRVHFENKHLNIKTLQKKTHQVINQLSPISSRADEIIIEDNSYVNVPPIMTNNLQTKTNVRSQISSSADFSRFGEEEFVCTFCIPPKKFTELVSFDKHHMTTHSPGNDLKCDVCNQNFSNKVHLSHHMKSIHGVKGRLHVKGIGGQIARIMTGEVACLTCGQKFNDITSCRNHIKQQHENEMTSDHEIEVYDNFVDVSKLSNSSQERDSYLHLQKVNPGTNEQILRDIHSLRAKSQEQDMPCYIENKASDDKESLSSLVQQIKEAKRRANSEG